MKLAAIFLAVLVGLTQVARADDYPDSDPSAAPQPDRPQRGQRGQKLRRALVEQFDRDGDGRLDPRERRQAARALRRLAKRMGEGRQNRRAKLIQKYDLDGDGNLGPGELPPRVQQRLRRFDRNGDGWLDQRDGRQRDQRPMR